jgi:hypothetical protein
MRGTVGLPIAKPSPVGEARRIAPGARNISEMIVGPEPGRTRDFTHPRPDGSTMVIARETRPEPS